MAIINRGTAHAVPFTCDAQPCSVYTQFKMQNIIWQQRKQHSLYSQCIQHKYKLDFSSFSPRQTSELAHVGLQSHS